MGGVHINRRGGQSQHLGGESPQGPVESVEAPAMVRAEGVELPHLPTKEEIKEGAKSFMRTVAILSMVAAVIAAVVGAITLFDRFAPASLRQHTGPFAGGVVALTLLGLLLFFLGLKDFLRVLLILAKVTVVVATLIGLVHMFLRLAPPWLQRGVGWVLGGAFALGAAAGVLYLIYAFIKSLLSPTPVVVSAPAPVVVASDVVVLAPSAVVVSEPSESFMDSDGD
jgi:hypothetical protein